MYAFENKKKKILNISNEQKVTNFGYIFVLRVHITLKNFSADSTNSFGLRP